MEFQQSVLSPSGVDAEGIATLSWIMFAGGSVIFIFVAVMVYLAWRGNARQRRGMASEQFIIYCGIAFPTVTVTALLIYGLALTGSRVSASAADAIRVEVIGEQWWWRVRYEEDDNRPAIATANELRIPVGRDIEIQLKSDNVIHSFWVPKLAGKVDMIPGVTNRIRLHATETGTFRGQCAEYCGGPHALMSFHVVASEVEEFEQWMAGQRRAAKQPIEPLSQRGQQVFVSTGCGGCHALRGTNAIGVAGPDLTHVGSRLSIAAATLPNNTDAFRNWVQNSQLVKPHNHMPSFDILSEAELTELAAYLESLQ